MADMVGLRELASNRDLWIVEDACQAHGAERDGLRAGSCSRAAAFSFYPGKNLGAFGDAGALTTSDGSLADTVRSLREHGQRRKYEHQLIGYTSRLDTIQAIVLQAKLARLETWNDERRAVAHAYGELLEGIDGLVLPVIASCSQPVWHLYVVRTDRRDELATHLRARGVGTGMHYPEPVHLSGAYSGLGYSAGAFPVSERAANAVLSLPIFPGMTYDQVLTVADGVRSFFSG
jgi:dTDP-4-amino-4,6-dideoxygalactose transaminase